jgi:hypothetical protein
VTRYDFESLSEAEAADFLCSRFQGLRDVGCDVQRALVFAIHPQFEVDEVELLVRSGAAELAATLLTLAQPA